MTRWEDWIAVVGPCEYAKHRDCCIFKLVTAAGELSAEITSNETNHDLTKWQYLDMRPRNTITALTAWAIRQQRTARMLSIT